MECTRFVLLTYVGIVSLLHERAMHLKCMDYRNPLLDFRVLFSLCCSLSRINPPRLDIFVAAANAEVVFIRMCELFAMWCQASCVGLRALFEGS